MRTLLEQVDEQSSLARAEELRIIIIMSEDYTRRITQVQKTVTKQLTAFCISIFQSPIHELIPVRSTAREDIDNHWLAVAGRKI